MEALRLRSVVAIVGFLGALVYLAPNFVATENIWWPTKKKLNYGLDIQGGLHLVMGVGVDEVLSESTKRLKGQIEEELSKANQPATQIVVVDAIKGNLRLEFASAEAAEQAWSEIKEFHLDKLQRLPSEGAVLEVRYLDNYVLSYKERVLNQAIETIRNRIDEFGVAEPSISAQGADRMSIQLPGLKDAEQAKALINTTAKLDFMMLDESFSVDTLQSLITEAETKAGFDFKSLKYSQYVDKLNMELKGQLPPDTILFFEKAPNAQSLEVGRIPYLLKTNTGLGGDELEDAFVGYGQFGEPVVNLRFNPSGAAKFAEITGANVGKQMAIVLDKVVKSAPSIKDRIAGGSAVITMNSSRNMEQNLNEAKMIATSLRAGSLPASLEQLEERRVGPSLGADSIKKAELAGLVGSILIFLFLIFRYKAGGVISVVTLVLNVLFSLAVLSSLGATLTLPGIAGIALTIGYAVDSNVLILERMREELAAGSGLKSAISEGFNKAISAILDANVTTGSTAVVLLYFGTGPVKGFAVTLLIGIFATMFSNVFISKVLLDNMVYKFGVKKLSL